MDLSLTIQAAAVCCDQPDHLLEFAVQAYPIDKTLLPATLRRRTAMTTHVAITAAVQACRMAAVDTEELPSIFASVGGEIQVTDVLCRTLPDSQALLSPTQFHNSVHNTTAGYWSIINACQAPATAIAALDDTFAMALLEAYSQLQQKPGHLLLVCYDELWPQYLAPPMGKACFASAWILSNQSDNTCARRISVPRCVAHQPIQAESLVSFIRQAPAAAAIPLLQAWQSQQEKCDIPLNINAPQWVTELH